jgi:hypothetical protein
VKGLAVHDLVGEVTEPGATLAGGVP